MVGNRQTFKHSAQNANDKMEKEIIHLPNNNIMIFHKMLQEKNFDIIFIVYFSSEER